MGNDDISELKVSDLKSNDPFEEGDIIITPTGKICLRLIEIDEISPGKSFGAWTEFCNVETGKSHTKHLVRLINSGKGWKISNVGPIKKILRPKYDDWRSLVEEC